MKQNRERETLFEKSKKTLRRAQKDPWEGPEVCACGLSVTRLGDFLNFLVINFITKVAQILW